MGDLSAHDKTQDITAAFLENRNGLLRYLLGFLRNTGDAEDVSQEVFIRAYKAAQKRPVKQPKSFLYRIARNAAFTELKRRSDSIIQLVDNLAPELAGQVEPSAEENFTQTQRMTIFWQAVDTLPPQCRRVFVMRKVFGFSHKEIAAALAISTSTVEKHLASGLQKCIKHARGREDDEGVVYLRPSLGQDQS